MMKCVFRDTLFGDNWTGSGTAADPLLFKKTLYGLNSININLPDNGQLIIEYADGEIFTTDIDAGTEKTIQLKTEFGTFGILKLIGCSPGTEINKFIKFYKNINASDYINGVGGIKGDDNLKQTGIVSSGISQYPIVKPGYFYIDNEEYYLFANMKKVKLSEVSGPYEYKQGEPYFIVPDSFTSENICKIPVNKNYEVDWTSDGENWIPTPSGYAYDEDLYLVFEEGTERTLTRRIPFEDKYLVLKKVPEVADATTLEVKPMWVPYVRANTMFRSYALAEDSSGIRIPDVHIMWYEVKEDDSVEYKGMATTNADGVAYCDFILEGTLSGSHIFVKTESVISPSIWIQTPGAFMGVYVGVFQLDTTNIWDSQQAKTAMGFNCFASQPSGLYGEIWGSSGVISTDITQEEHDLWPGLAPMTHEEWELFNPEFERPPITSNEGTGNLINEDFETAFPPADWTENTCDWSEVYFHSLTHSVKFQNGSDYLITPLLAEPNILTYWMRASAGLSNFIIEYSYDLSSWMALTGSPTTTDYDGIFKQETFDLSSYNDIYIKFRRGDNKTYYLDDVTITGSDERNGYWNAYDYNIGHGHLPVPSGVNPPIGIYPEGEEVPPSGIPTPSGIVNTMKDMRVTVDGYWGQYLVSGYDIRTTYALALGIKNAANDYYINRTDNFDGYSVFGDLGSWNDIVAGGSTAPYKDRVYDTVMYVLYTPENYYSLEFDPTVDFYFRGVAIYSIEEDNILEYNEQDRTVEDVSSYAYLE